MYSTCTCFNLYFRRTSSALVTAPSSSKVPTAMSPWSTTVSQHTSSASPENPYSTPPQVSWNYQNEREVLTLCRSVCLCPNREDNYYYLYYVVRFKSKSSLIKSWCRVFFVVLTFKSISTLLSYSLSIPPNKKNNHAHQHRLKYTLMQMIRRFREKPIQQFLQYWQLWVWM